MRNVIACCVAVLVLAAPCVVPAENDPIPVRFAEQVLGDMGLSIKDCPSVIADDPVMTSICIESHLGLKEFRKAWDQAVAENMDDYPGLEITTDWLKAKKSHSKTYSIGKYFMIIQFGHKNRNVIFLYFKQTV